MIFEKQDYQEECVSNIISVLFGYDFKQNSINTLHSNLNSFYKTSPMPELKLSDKRNLDILMETGTGKTFTYLKTIYELNKQYNVNKFIIFVPRKAIREGVLQNIELTSDYFMQEYDKRLVKYTYEGKNSLNAIQHHYLKNEEELSVLVLTNSSIDKEPNKETGKEKNILRQYRDGLFGAESILKSIQQLNPVIFIDEPHLLKGEAFTRVFEEFDSLYFRFGATFPNEEQHKLSNMIYSLDSISSFKNYLVKKIRVNTIITHDSRLKVNTATKKEIELLYFQDGEEKKGKVKLQEDIGQITGLSEYNGVHVVNVDNKAVYLSNNTELNNTTTYVLPDDEIRLMIKQTIEIHFEKEERFFIKGVKTLSLFFIPNIADFRSDTPKIKTIFEEEYKQIRTQVLLNTTNEEYKKYLERDFDEEGQLAVHQGYFSGDRGSLDDKATEGIDLILSDKERLLSLNTPLRFIFSVWALQEGWDNPNVFQICKLSQTSADISRRQQIGRGLRICVNQEGKRLTYNYLDENEIDFYYYNTLDVIVSGQEKNFIEEIQNEINLNSFIRTGDTLTQDYFKTIGLNESQSNRLEILLEDNNIIKLEDNKFIVLSPILEFIKDNKDKVLTCKIDEPLFAKLCFQLNNYSDREIVENANKKLKTIAIRQDKLALFRELWELINRKAKIVYKDIKEDQIIDSIISLFNQENIPEIHSENIVKEYNAKTDTIENKDVKDLGKIEFLQKESYKKFVMNFAKDERLPLTFVLKLFNKLDKTKIQNNPRESKIRLKAIIKDSIHQNILQSVHYSLESEVKITSLQNKDGSYKTELKYTDIGHYPSNENAPQHFLFDKVVFDSKIEKKATLDDPQNIDGQSITVFAKLPKISIPTPYKHYNPDFAYLLNLKSGKTLFLVVETKGYNKESDIPEEEKMKIKYAEKFFDQLQKETPSNIEVVFKKRINKIELTDLLRDIKG